MSVPDVKGPFTNRSGSMRRKGTSVAMYWITTLVAVTIVATP